MNRLSVFFVVACGACAVELTLPEAPNPVVPGSLGGLVLAGEAPAPGATIELPFAGLTTTSAADGSFEFPALPAGAYTVRVGVAQGASTLAGSRDAVAVFAGARTDAGRVCIR